MGALLALLVLIAALLAIFWTPPRIENFDLWLIIGLALAILLGGISWSSIPWPRRQPPQQ